jgi:hypothetical protein
MSHQWPVPSSLYASNNSWSDCSHGWVRWGIGAACSTRHQSRLPSTWHTGATNFSGSWVAHQTCLNLWEQGFICWKSFNQYVTNYHRTTTPKLIKSCQIFKRTRKRKRARRKGAPNLTQCFSETTNMRGWMSMSVSMFLMPGPPFNLGKHKWTWVPLNGNLKEVHIR